MIFGVLLSTLSTSSIFVQTLWSQGDFESCLIVSKKVLEEDPYHLAALPVAWW
jgi:hypothetical protein